MQDKDKHDPQPSHGKDTSEGKGHQEKHGNSQEHGRPVKPHRSSTQTTVLSIQTR
jgi:hypothetical protein